MTRSVLHHRFRGTLLGACVGQTLGIRMARAFRRSTEEAGLAIAPPESRSVNPEANPDADDFNSQWGMRALDIAQLLIAGSWGRANVSLPFSPDPQLSQPEPGHPTPPPAFSLSREPLPSIADPGGLAIATLPLGLFFHEDPASLHHHLHELLSVWDVPPAHQLAVGLFLHSLGLALREQLIPEQLLSQLRDDFGSDLGDSGMTSGLGEVDDLINGEADAAIALARLQNASVRRPADSATPPDLPASGRAWGDPLPILLALYGFLSLPTEPQLAMERLRQPLQSSRRSTLVVTTCTLLGALLGAYHGELGIPLKWHWAIAPWGVKPSSSNSEQNDMTWLALLDLADPLAAAWIGADHPGMGAVIHPVPAIAVPRYINRPSRRRGMPL